MTNNNIFDNIINYTKMFSKENENSDGKAVDGPRQNRGNQIIKKEGRVTEALPNAFFRIELSDGKEILGFLSGKMRMHRITILPGDKVSLEMSPYDEEKGRIVYRLK